MIIIGIDWAKYKHDLIFMDKDGKVLDHIVVEHVLQGFTAITDRIRDYETNPDEVMIGIEHHDGALICFLLAWKYRVFMINPKSAQRARDRYAPSGKKDDKTDAYVIADMVRTDRGNLRQFRPDSQYIKEVRGWLVFRAKRVNEKTRKIQKLWEILSEWCPGMQDLCHGYECIWHRDLLKLFPLQQDFYDAPKTIVEEFIKGHRMRHKTREKLWDLRKVDPIRVPEHQEKLLRMQITQHIESIDLDHKEIKGIEKELDSLINNHPDSEILLSLPVKGTLVTSLFVVTFGSERLNGLGADDLAAITGVAPITISSGKSRRVRRRRACDHLLLEILLYYSFATLQRSAWARKYYDEKRAAGKGHYGALRCLSKKWLRIIRRMWIDKTPYNENFHLENQLKHKKLAA